MAGETSAEMTIVVRAQDAATKEVAKISSNVSATIKRVLLAPINSVRNAAAGIVKQFFSLKGLLLGGGIIAAVKGLSDGLSTSAKEFRAVFGPATQRGINAVDEAFGRLGASIKSTFGAILGDNASSITALLDGMSDWLRDNRADIVSFFKTVAEGVRDIVALVRQLASGGTTFGKLVGFSGTNILGVPRFGGDGSAEARRAIEHDAAVRFDVARSSLPRQSIESMSRNYEAVMASFRAAAEQVGAGEGATMVDRLVSSDSLERLNDLASTMATITDGFTTNTEAVQRVADAWAGGDQSLTSALRAATIEVEKFNAAKSGAAPIVGEVTAAVKEEKVAVEETTKAVAELEVVTKAAIIAFDEVAESVAGNVTDGLFEFIERTKSAAQAFGGMVSSILRELGRLLVYRSLLSSILSLGAGAAGSALPGDATSSGVPVGGLRGGFASGGIMRAGGVASVGENGPERVVLPGGSRVVPAHRSRGGDGTTVNVFGARDARATAREVAAEMRRNATLRRSLA